MFKFVIFSMLSAFFLTVTSAFAQQVEQAQDPVFEESYTAAREARALVLGLEFDAAAPIALPLAQAGNPVAQNLMGIIYERTIGPDESILPALEMYDLAAAQDYPKAMHNAALLYLEGRTGVPFDPAKAVEAYRAAAALGYGPSHEELVWHLMWGAEAVQDHAEAFQLATLGVQDHPESAQLHNLLADCYYYGMGTTENLSTALEHYETSAGLGDSYGQFSAGYQYFLSEGTEGDDVTARAYFDLAAAQDYGTAYGFLAHIHFYGYGTEPNYGRAFEYATLGQGRDTGQASFFVGEAYRDGLGVDGDIVAARAAYKQSYDEGYTYGLQRLGDLAYFGEGEAENFPKAFEIYERVMAEDPDEEDAPYSMAYMLMRGEGVAVDLPRAVELIELAVSLGHWESMGEAILLYGGSEFGGDFSGRIPAAAHCLHARNEGFLASLEPQGVINTICIDTMRDLSGDERDLAKTMADGL